MKPTKKTKKTHHPIYYYDETFRINYYISYGVPLNVWIESAIHHICHPGEYDDSVQGAVRIFNQTRLCKGKDKGKIIENRVAWIWTLKKDIHTLYHECGHAIKDSMRYVGVPTCIETDEVYLYQVEMLVKKGCGVE